MLLAAGEKLPEKIVAHGWWTVNGEKMSKSKGNVVDPIAEVEKYGVDAFRYFLLAEVHFGSDGDYNTTAMINRVNANLSNDLGNLLNRTLGMYKKYFNSEVVAGEGHEIYDDEIKELWVNTLVEVDKYMSTVEFSKALDSIWKFVSRMNKYIDETMPWALAKSDEGKPRLAVVLKNLVEALNKIAVLVYPYIPESASKMWEQLGITKDIKLAKVEDVKEWDVLEVGHILGEATPIFPRLEKPEVKVELEIDENLVVENPIDITDFEKVEMKVVEILEAEFAPDSKRMIKFKVETGSGIRQIISGIGKTYKKPEELVGKKVMAVLNLTPAEIQGNLSQGMLLTTVEKKRTKLVFIDDAVKVASKIK